MGKLKWNGNCHGNREMQGAILSILKLISSGNHKIPSSVHQLMQLRRYENSLTTKNAYLLRPATPFTIKDDVYLGLIIFSK